MRSLNPIIDQIIEEAPILAPHFKSLQELVLYTAPELMYVRWNQAAAILTEYATDLRNSDEIANIFNGRTSNE